MLGFSTQHPFVLFLIKNIHILQSVTIRQNFSFRSFVNSMNGISNISFQNSSIVKQYGKTDDDRLIVGVKDIDSDNYIKSTIPEENYDQFEEFANNTQNNYGKYLKDHGRKGSQLLYAVNIACATLGASISATCLKKASKTKTFFGTIGGALAGIGTASVVMAGALIAKLVKMNKTAKSLDIRPYKEPAKPVEEKTNKAPEEKQPVEKKKDKETETV